MQPLDCLHGKFYRFDADQAVTLQIVVASVTDPQDTATFYLSLNEEEMFNQGPLTPRFAKR